VLFLPTHDYLKRTKASGAGIRHPLCGQGLLPHLHAHFAGGGAGEIASAGRRGVPAGPSDRRFVRIAGIPDDAHHRQHLLSLGPRRVRQRRVSHLRDDGRLCDGKPARRLARRRAQPSHRPSSVPFRVPHPLCSADPDCEGDRRRVWRSLSATSHHDAGNLASSDTFEATGKRN
jgi:hypothetical protein